ncbi:MAG TPA: peptidoglycan DD-metalloendopeptidase family protein [Halomonas sp.]|nr:peptidoglycan DD-metalloendopeptidase family protein [Halomonas sp.]
MYRRLLIGGLAMVLAGCATQQEQAPVVRVEDLSSSRASASPEYYTVQSGDTLYNIAWRHGMDYRDMARRNDIQPPYTLHPGQKLVLSDGGSAPGKAAADGGLSADSSANGPGPVVATGLGSDQAVAAAGEEGSLEWLLPEESAGETLAAPGPVIGDDVVAAAEATAGAATEQPRALDARTAEAVAGAEATVKKTRADAADAEAQERQRAEQADRQADQQTQEAKAAKAEGEAEAGAQKKAAQAEQAAAPASQPKRYVPVDEVPWSWPVNGRVTGAFGEGSSVTAGIDIAGQKGQSVKAAGPGIVVYAGDGVRGYGNLILIKHNDQFLSAYAHNDELKVKENDVVDVGDVIATMGDSGADSVRLHFEVRKDGQPQNPLDYLPKR